MTKTCTIYFSGLTLRYHLGFGATRSRNGYKTVATALRAAARQGYEVTEVTEAQPNRTKIVMNLISGRLVRIPVDTPACCDPSTESYWSM